MKPRSLPGPEIYDGIESLGLSDDLQGWHSQSPVFGDILGEINPKIIVEVGSWKGASAIHMAQLCPAAKIYCVDHWLGGIDHELSQDNPTSVLPRNRGYPTQYFQFLHNVARAGLQFRIVPVVQTSINGARLLKAHGIIPDAVYVDGSHEYPDAFYDMMIYWSFLPPGGVMFGDDLSFIGVHASLARFAIETGTKPEELGEFWVVEKQK